MVEFELIWFSRRLREHNGVRMDGRHRRATRLHRPRALPPQARTTQLQRPSRRRARRNNIYHQRSQLQELLELKLLDQ